MILTNSTGFIPLNIDALGTARQGFTTDPAPIFGLHCVALSNLGLLVIPTGGDDGKKPLVTFPKRRYSPATVQRLSRKFANDNVAILTGAGACPLTVIDIDDPDLSPCMIARFGDTPVQVSTPKGGVHLYYRHSGEGSVTGLDGLRVDIRGTRGIIIAPPSIRRCDPFKGQAYTFIKGGWDDLKNLPTLKPGSLVKGHQKPTGSLHSVEAGTRNDRLFKRLMQEARHCDDLSALRDVALTLNGDMPEPLPEAEALRIAESAWKYEEKGANWCGAGGVVAIPRAALDLLKSNPNAYLLYSILKAEHDGIRKEFAVSPRGMADAGVIPGWSHKGYRAARDVLTESGLLVLIRQGGRHGNDPSLYRLA